MPRRDVLAGAAGWRSRHTPSIYQYPNIHNTGVPAGTSLTLLPVDVDGVYYVDTPGTVLDSVHVPGIVLIRANNVTVRKSRVDTSIINDYAGVFYQNTLIEDCEIGPDVGHIVGEAIGTSSYTARRNYIHGSEDGFRAGAGNVLIEDNYVRNGWNDPNAHSDGFQDYTGGPNLVLRHNTIDMSWMTDGYTAPIYIGGNYDINNTDGVTLDNNLLAGGTYTMQLHWKAGPWSVTGNKVVNGTWAYGPASTENMGGHIATWSGNEIVTVDADYNITSVVSPLLKPDSGV